MINGSSTGAAFINERAEEVTDHQGSSLLLLYHPIFPRCIKAGAVFLHAGQVAVTGNACLGIVGPELLQELQERTLLLWRTCVSGDALRTESPLITDAYGVLVVASCVGSRQLQVTRLPETAVAGDVVVVARKAEAVGMASDERRDREWPVTARC